MAKGSKSDKKSKKDKSKTDSKGKSSNKSGKSKPEANINWEENLEKEIISDARWKCNVTLLNESCADSCKYVSDFQEFASLGKRQVVKPINLKDIFSQIKQECRGDNKDGEAHPLQGVCVEVAKQLANGDLSLQMFAKYIKFKIICLKEAEIKRKKMLIVREMKIREELMAQGLDECPAELIKQKMAEEDEALKNKKGGKGAKGNKKDKKGDKGNKKDKKGDKGKKKDDSKGGKGKGSEPPTNVAAENSEKVLTDLRKEGEEWLDIRDLNDAPPNGAELYVVLSGLNDPKLLLELIKLNVPINGLIKVDIDADCPPPVPDPLVDEEQLDPDFCEESDEEVNFLKGRRSSVVDAGCGKEEQSLCKIFSQGDRKTWQDDELAENDVEAKKFWAAFQLCKKDRPTATTLKDIAFFEYVSFNYKNCNWSAEELGTHKRKLFDDICQILYKLEESSRLHIKYIRSMKLVDIDDENVIKNLDDMEIYNTMSQMLPIECATPEFILNCLTEQVAFLCKPQSVLEIDNDLSEHQSLQSQPNEAEREENEYQPVTPSKIVDSLSGAVNSQNITTSEEITSRSSVDTEQEKVELAQEEMNKVFEKLNIQYGLAQVPIEHVARKDPLVILNNDIVTQKTYHVAVEEVDLAAITSDMLKDGPVPGLWRQYPSPTELKVPTYNQHIFKLWQCMDGNITFTMLKSYLHLLICEKMTCFSEDDNKLPEVEYSNENLTDNAEINGGISKRFASLLGLLGINNSSSNNSKLDEAQILYKSHLKDMEGIGEMLGSPRLASLTGQGESMIEKPQNTSPLYGFNAVEYYNSNVMLQCLANAYESYSCLDYHYYPPTDSIMLNFHKSRGKTGVLEKNWSAKLASPVAFADFKMYVMPEELPWIQKVLTAELEAAEAEALNEVDIENALKKEVDKLEDQDLMLRGSMKLYDRVKAEADDIDREREEARAQSKGGQDKGSKKDKGSKGSKKDKGSKKEKGGKKEKKEKTAKGKKDKESSKGSKKSEKGKKGKGKGKDTEEEIEVELPIVHRLSLRCAREDEPTEFIGFNLGELRVQVNGKTTWFYSADGTEVRVDNVEHVYGVMELFLNVVSRGHKLTFHSYTGPSDASIQKPLVYHLTSTDGVVLAFGKHVKKSTVVPVVPVEVPVAEPEEVEKEEEKVKKTDKSAAKGGKNKKTKAKTSTSIEKKSETSLSKDEPTEEVPEPVQPDPTPVILPWEYDLRVSWPSGLYIETLEGNTEHNPFKIKQRYLSKGPHCNQIHDEDYRIFQRNGTILKFMTNGFVQILSQDSSIVLCRGFEKYAPDEEPPPDALTLPKVPSTVDDGCYENVKPHAPYPPYPPTPPFVPPSPYLNITDYHVILPNGKQYSVTNKVVDEKHEKFLFRQATDFFLGEVFTRRGDGVNTLLKPDGSLVVVFTDGSRITTSFTEDPEPVRIEWTDEEKEDIIARIAQRKAEEVVVQSETNCMAANEMSKSESIFSKGSLKNLQSSKFEMKAGSSTINSVPEESVAAQSKSNSIAAHEMSKNELTFSKGSLNNLQSSKFETKAGSSTINSVPEESVAAQSKSNSIAAHEMSKNELTFSKGSLNNLQSSKFETKAGSSTINSVPEERVAAQSKSNSMSAHEMSKSESTFGKESVNTLQSSALKMKAGSSTINSVPDFTNTNKISSMEQLFNDDGFVKVNLVTCMEHPNYATVSYFGHDCSAIVGMPNATDVHISAKGHYNVHCDGETTLQVTPDRIHFNTSVCLNCKAESKTEIDLTGFEPDNEQDDTKIFCKTSDSFGKTFRVNYNGSTSTETEQEYEDESPESYCLPDLLSSHNRRSFVLNRDLTGAEFYNCADVKKYLLETRKKDGAIMVTELVPNKSLLKYHMCLEPIWKTQSERWLMDYSCKNVLPNRMVKKHFSSTYGDPPSWFHPFPAASDESVTSIRYGIEGGGDADEVPEIFRLRIIHEMQPGDQSINAIDIIQKGLRKYWVEAARKFEIYKHHVFEDPRANEDMELDEHLMSLAMGTSEVSVAELRQKDKEMGLRPSLGEFEPVKPEAKWHPEFMENFREKAIQNEKDKQAYLELLRTNNVTPYFESVPGRFFLMALKAVEDASNAETECGKNVTHARRVINEIIRDNQELEEEELAEVLEREMACRLCYCKDQTQCRTPNVL